MQFKNLFVYRLNIPTLHFVLYLLFFFSGCSALIYQVMWQRMLFTLFGVDLFSVTIVISVFMFGLGIGGLCGGLLADIMSSKLLTLFIIIELMIGLFGFLSPHIITFLECIQSNSEWIVALKSCLVFAAPTLLMGATFPILVTHVNHFDQNIGQSVGGLYFVNTLGGAVGAYFSGFIFLYSMDLIGAVDRAAFLNVAVALVAFLMLRREA